MKISQAISFLQEILVKDGDLDICAFKRTDVGSYNDCYYCNQIFVQETTCVSLDPDDDSTIRGKEKRVIFGV